MKFSGKIDAEQVLGSVGIQNAVKRRTDEIARNARALAPVDSGELKASITTSFDRNGGVKRDRPVGTVRTHAEAEDGSGYGSAEEFGTSRGRGEFFLRRAAGSS